MEKKVILLVRPCYDSATKYLHQFSGEVIKKVEEVNEYKIINLEKKKVTREEFEKVISKLKPRLVLFNGHGNKNMVCGHDSEPILDKNNITVLDSKIAYSVACDSSEQLGELAIEEGKADAYIGYDGKFMIIVDPSKTATPEKDNNIKPFRKVYAMMILSLLSGLTVETSIEKTKEQIKELIIEYGVDGIRDKYGDAPLIRWALYWDLFCLSGHGDLQAVV